MHPRTGDSWCIYPTYDYAHGQTDAIEGITHSVCTLEFEDHRPLYDWLIDNLPVPFRPRQYEFSRLNVTHTVLSKRRLMQLVSDGHVDGWDDPRMPTLSGLRRRGVPAATIRDFMSRLSISKTDGIVEQAALDHAVREYLNEHAERRMAVLRPLKLTIKNWPEGKVDWLDAANHPGNPDAGNRKIPFSGSLYIERDDFLEDPPSKFFRLGPGREVRLRFGYFVTCTDFVKNENGEVVELRCTYDPETRGGDAPDGRKVKGTIHWVSADHALEAVAALYNPLFTTEQPGAETGEFLDDINPESLEILKDCRVEPSLAELKPGENVQFERLGYFCADSISTSSALCFNRTVGLRDSWSRAQTKGK